jgi:hypothetical protein
MAVTIDGSAGVTTNAGGSVNPSTTIDGINYSCRAWVSFNGTGTVAIRASGNVSSITDDATGRYRINFTTAMSDVNYAANVTGYEGAANGVLGMIGNLQPYLTTSFQISINGAGTGAGFDGAIVNVIVLR